MQNDIVEVPSRATTAIAMIAAERADQLGKHGFDAAHDDQLGDDDLLNAAMAVLKEDLDLWPDKMDRSIFFKATEKGEAERRVVAAALIVADVDKILRARQRSAPLPVLALHGRVRIRHDLYHVLIASFMEQAQCEHLSTLAQREGTIVRRDLKHAHSTVKVDGYANEVELPDVALIPLPQNA